MDSFKRHTEKKCWKERMSDIGQLVIRLLKISCYKYIKTITQEEKWSWSRSKIGFLNETKKEHTIQNYMNTNKFTSTNLVFRQIWANETSQKSHSLFLKQQEASFLFVWTFLKIDIFQCIFNILLFFSNVIISTESRVFLIAFTYYGHPKNMPKKGKTTSF